MILWLAVTVVMEAVVVTGGAGRRGGGGDCVAALRSWTKCSTRYNTMRKPATDGSLICNSVAEVSVFF